MHSTVVGSVFNFEASNMQVEQAENTSELYQQLITLNDMDLISNPEEFECSLCITTCRVGEGVVLHDCFHTFCRKCLTERVELSDGSEITCPDIEQGSQCTGKLEQREIKAESAAVGEREPEQYRLSFSHLVSQEIYQNYLDKSLLQAEKESPNAFHCKTPSCKGWCILEENVNEFCCPICLTTNYLVYKEECPRNKKYEVVEYPYHHYLQLLDLENADLVPNPATFDCPICLETCKAGEGIALRDCIHTFCRQCLRNAVEFSEDAEVRCPFRDANYTCESVLQEREIRALVPHEVYLKHVNKSILRAEPKIGNTFHCKTPDCKGWCIIDGDVYEFNCPVCLTTNCIQCQAIHTGLSCMAYLDEKKCQSEACDEAKKSKEMIKEMVNQEQAMVCPACNAVIMKESGCDFLTCSVCKMGICWVTKGPRWGPKGHGDTSGGCRCGANGKRCHPNCGNCH